MRHLSFTRSYLLYILGIAGEVTEAGPHILKRQELQGAAQLSHSSAAIHKQQGCCKLAISTALTRVRPASSAQPAAPLAACVMYRTSKSARVSRALR